MEFDINGIIGTVMVVFFSLLGCLLAGVIIWYWWFSSQYKHKAYVEEIIGEEAFFIEDKARLVKDKDKNRYWQLWKMRDRIPEPTPESLTMTKKGRKVAFFWYVPEAGYIPKGRTKGYLMYKDKLDYDDFKKKIPQGHEPLTPPERAALINEIMAAEQYKGISWKDWAVAATPFISIIIIVTLLLSFWGDIVQPFGEMGDRVVQAIDKTSVLIDKIDALENGVTTVGGVASSAQINASGGGS